MQFAVSVPITMHVSILIDAPDAESAKDVAFQTDFGFNIVGKDTDKVEIIEWEMHSQIVRGNCFSGVINEIDVEVAD